MKNNPWNSKYQAADLIFARFATQGSIMNNSAKNVIAACSWFLMACVGEIWISQWIIELLVLDSQVACRVYLFTEINSMYPYYEFRCKLLKMGNTLLSNTSLVHIHVRLRPEPRTFLMKKISHPSSHFLDFGKNHLPIIKS